MAIEKTPLPRDLTHSAHLNKERQRKLPPAKKCAPYISYSKRSATLFNAIVDGHRKQKQIIKPRSKPKQGRKKDTALMVLKKGRVAIMGMMSRKQQTSCLVTPDRSSRLTLIHSFRRFRMHVSARRMTTNHFWHCVVWSKKY
jgi:hypothetical protein